MKQDAPRIAQHTPHRFARDAGPEEAHLRVLHMSDLHAHLIGWDYHEDRPAPGLGLSGLAALTARARAGAQTTLLLDGGDMLQGAPLGDLAAAERLESGPQAAPHPVIAAMNALGVDAAGLGNHDFNYGLDMAQEAAAAAAFPVLLANLHRPGEAPRGGEGGGGAGAEIFQPWTVLERNLRDGAGRARPLRIGLFAICPPQVMLWDARHLEGRAEAEDCVSAAARAVAALREAGAEIILALSHSGVAPGPHAPGAENAALAIAALDGVDAVLSGHQHLRLPGPDFEGLAGVDAAAGRLHGKPALMPGCNGEWLGVMELLLRHDGARWRLADAECRLERNGGEAAASPCEGLGAPWGVACEEADGAPAGARGLEGVAAGAAPGAGADMGAAGAMVAEAARRDGDAAPEPSGARRTQAAPAPAPAGFAETARAPFPTRPPGDLVGAVLRAACPAHLRTLAAARAPMGATAAPLRSRFSMVADSAPVRLIAMAQRAWADAVFAAAEDPALRAAAALPRLSAAAPFRAGWRGGPAAWVDIPAGPLRRRHVDMIYPYPNPLALLIADGAALRLWLERSAAAWAQVRPGDRDVPLLLRDAAPYNMDLIHGLSWEVDLSRPALFDALGAPACADPRSGRIRALRHRGRPVEDADRFVLIANAYRAGGGGRFPGLPGLPLLPAPEIAGPAALARLLTEREAVDPAPVHPFRFTPIPGASATLPTAPDAPVGEAAAAETGGLRMEDAGRDAEGFGLRRILF